MDTCLGCPVGSRPAHERDPVDDDGQVLRVHRLDGRLVGRELEDVDAERADGGDERRVLLARKAKVDRIAARL